VKEKNECNREIRETREKTSQEDQKIKRAEKSKFLVLLLIF
jgi:hypothetical protein